jgi:hypothetical protein
MSKFIRFSFWLIFIIGALVLALAFYEPNDVTVTRSTWIHAQKEPVFDQIVHFNNWANWSNLLAGDTSVKITIAGTSGQPGSSLDWKGDEGITGEGVIKNEGLEGSAMRYSFVVTVPASLIGDGVISAKDSGDYTKVTWTFHKNFPFLANAALVVFDLDKYMGGDIEKSLAGLKKYIETDVEPQVEIKEVDYPGGIVAGIRDTLLWTDLTTFFGDTYSLFAKTPPSKITGSPIGVFYDWDTVNKRTDVFAGFLVTDSEIPVNAITFSELPPSRAVMAVLKGNYTGSQKVHEALNRYIAKKGLSRWLTIEEYKVYPGNERDSYKWVTNIYVLVQ